MERGNTLSLASLPNISFSFQHLKTLWKVLITNRSKIESVVERGIETTTMISFRATDDVEQIINETMKKENLDSRSDAIILLIKRPSLNEALSSSDNVKASLDKSVTMDDLESLPLSKYNAFLHLACEKLRLQQFRENSPALHDI